MSPVLCVSGAGDQHTSIRTNEASNCSCRWSTDDHAESSLIDRRRGNAGGNAASGAALPLLLTPRVIGLRHSLPSPNLAKNTGVGGVFAGAAIATRELAP